jgi:hypothetical protein
MAATATQEITSALEEEVPIVLSALFYFVRCQSSFLTDEEWLKIVNLLACGWFLLKSHLHVTRFDACSTCRRAFFSDVENGEYDNSPTVLKFGVLPYREPSLPPVNQLDNIAKKPESKWHFTWSWLLLAIIPVLTQSVL